VQTEIKWVNDLLLDGRKVCGILSESGTDEHGEPYILLGIGINTGDTVFEGELSQIAACIPCEDKDALLRAVLSELEDVERAVRESSWLDAYRACSAVLGKRVVVIDGERRRLATALDILPGGALLVELESGERDTLYGSEISLRLTQ
jgi:BirA family biotin operon repressor/biotin-[acetyl-CoA-carboxylase] ligase